MLGYVNFFVTIVGNLVRNLPGNMEFGGKISFHAGLT